MLINTANLKVVYTAFNGRFKAGLEQAAPNDHLLFTEIVNSTTGEEEYPWLGDVPSMREWVGDRVINNLTAYGYKIANKDFEDTIQVPRNAIEDDKYGAFGMRFELMGRAVAADPCMRAFATLKAGFSTACYDGQFFFDTDHPVLDKDGVLQSVANTDGGNGEPWFLMCSTAPVKPIIQQRRQEPRMVSLDNVTDDNVFMRKQFLYGVDDRKGFGYSFWQTIWGSKQALTPTTYALARQKLLAMTGDYGRPLGNRPDTLLVGPSNESAARKIAINELGSNGETNEWKGTATPNVSAWLVA